MASVFKVERDIGQSIIIYSKSKDAVQETLKNKLENVFQEKVIVRRA